MPTRQVGVIITPNGQKWITESLLHDGGWSLKLQLPSLVNKHYHFRHPNGVGIVSILYDHHSSFIFLFLSNKSHLVVTPSQLYQYIIQAEKNQTFDAWPPIFAPYTHLAHRKCIIPTLFLFQENGDVTTCSEVQVEHSSSSDIARRVLRLSQGVQDNDDANTGREVRVKQMSDFKQQVPQGLPGSSMRTRPRDGTLVWAKSGGALPGFESSTGNQMDQIWNKINCGYNANANLQVTKRDGIVTRPWQWKNFKKQGVASLISRKRAIALKNKESFSSNNAEGIQNWHRDRLVYYV
ncbi:hypothetical protein K435DRAFT_808898 [Dendrothele bispora CBS 962.96]|uniref:Uncharacterized protein n=1 Tax=Dendrothele bispora (strain CBS 962.96) TaxID=1314807 RepID=A0A4S8L059_DENBC|nr:hypothetical protein K435DRAFT_808898 [Dendrothele bispora CBS 962.96]